MDNFSTAYTYDDVALVPQYNNVPSRTIPSLSSWITKKTKIDVPIVPANMDTVIGDEMADALLKYGSMPIFHRFTGEDKRMEWAYKYGDRCYMSCGLNDLDFTLKILKETPVRGVCIDVAHAHSSTMKNYMEEIRKHIGDSKEIIAGNVCTPIAYHDLVTWGADAVKCGIGGGCFKGDTRILMANGTYKNIENINVDDMVINKNGIAVKVLTKLNKGIKDVIKIRTGLYCKPTIVTPDHNFFVGDMSNVSKETISNKGIAKLLDQQSKTIPKQSKYKWKEINNCDSDDTVLLFPKTITWSLPENFTIDLNQYLKKGVVNDTTITTNKTNTFNRIINSTYDLGYLFGTYLGDGHARVEIRKPTNSESGSVFWYFGINEDNIVNKLSNCINNLFGIMPIIKKEENKSITIVKFYNKCLANVLVQFGIKTNKHLESNYYCKNKEYIKGIYDGLIDSDGHREVYAVNTIEAFTNTSTQLMELFSWCCFNLGKSYGSDERPGGQGGLKNIKDDAVFNDSYRIKTHSNNRFTKDYMYTRIFDKSDVIGTETVWDIEVDCPTHSFVANNVIVHNSCCSTRIVTGFGVPQFSAVYECGKVAEKLRTPLIADGGIKESRDIVLALAAGASTVMAGGMFSNTYESAAPKETRDGIVYSKYRGQASQDFQEDFYGEVKKNTVAEGVAFEKICTRSVVELLDEMTGGLRSGLTYGGAKDIKELQRKAEFRATTSSYMMESKPRETSK